MSSLLLLSNSTSADGYLVHALQPIAALVDDLRQTSAQASMRTVAPAPAQIVAQLLIQAVFVPFAGVTRDWDDYAHTVVQALAALPIRIEPVHRAGDPLQAVRKADMIIVGGGNTFHLLHHCRRLGLLEAMRERVRQGVPYLGWSAGANLACPSICTTNDMPIVDPGGFDALGLIPFQINPHYTNALPPGVRGESRNQRLAEFTRLRPEMPVLGLPEGNWLHAAGNELVLGGPHPSYWFHGEAAPRELPSGAQVPHA